MRLATLARKASTAFSLPLREHIWLLLLYPLSAVIRAMILLAPFRNISRYFGLHYQNIQLSSVVCETQRLQAWRIGRLCELVALFTPWQSKCLVQALMAKTLLRYYRIPYVLYLGVTKPGIRGGNRDTETVNGMKAHAWVKVGPWVVTGRDGHQAFTVVSTFVCPDLVAPTTPMAPR